MPRFFIVLIASLFLVSAGYAQEKKAVPDEKKAEGKAKGEEKKAEKTGEGKAAGEGKAKAGEKAEQLPAK